VEHCNDTFDKKFLRTERFASPTELIDRYDAFQTFHNANHRYAALKGATPNQVEWIRLVRSDEQLRVLDHRFTMPDALTYEYVTATLIVEDQELVVPHQDREISRHPYPLR